MDPLRKPSPHITLVPRQSPVVEEPPPPFWPRVARATTLLLVAVVAHTWLVRAPQPLPSPFAAGVPGFAPHVVAPVAANLAAEAARTGARQPAPQVAEDARIRVEHTFVEAHPASGLTLRRPTSPQPLEFRSAGKQPSPKPDDDATIVDARQTEAPPVSGPGDAVEASRPIATPLALRVPSMQLLSTVELSGVPEVLAAPAPRPPFRRDPGRAASEVVTVSAGPVDVASELRKQKEIVLQVLRDYQQAYERLDVSAAQALWPTLDVRALQNAFKDIEAQQVRLGTCGVDIHGRDANARCPFEATYRPKVGSRVVRITEREWLFNLSRNDAGWQIVNATIQTAH